MTIIKKYIEFSFFITLFIIAIILNSSDVYSQNNREIGLEDRYFVTNNKSVITGKIRIYQASENLIKFEVPNVNYAKISIYDVNSSLIRTYLFNNLIEGTYEISTSSGNYKKGKYNCVLQTENFQESSIILIN